MNAPTFFVLLAIVVLFVLAVHHMRRKGMCASCGVKDAGMCSGHCSGCTKCAAVQKAPKP